MVTPDPSRVDVEEPSPRGETHVPTSRTSVRALTAAAVNVATPRFLQTVCSTAVEATTLSEKVQVPEPPAWRERECRRCGALSLAATHGEREDPAPGIRSSAATKALCPPANGSRSDVRPSPQDWSDELMPAADQPRWPPWIQKGGVCTVCRGRHSSPCQNVRRARGMVGTGG
jgi:hypothetical protein